jgi:hypothetical protein
MTRRVLGGKSHLCTAYLGQLYVKNTDHWTRFASGAVDGVQNIRAKVVDDSIVMEGPLTNNLAKWETQ